MIGDIVSTLLGFQSFSIFNVSTKTAFDLKVKVVKSYASFTAEPHRQMQEDGETIIDSKTIKPARLSFDVICPDVNVLSQVNKILLDRSSIFNIKSRGISFASFMVDSNFLSQSPEMLISTPIRMSFKQILIENTVPIIFANQADASIVDRGIAEVSAAANSVSELFRKAAADILG